MADQTRRYFADSSGSYALALVLLWEYARVHKDEQFVFGPNDLQAARDGGLVLSGRDLDGAARVLAGVPGLQEDREDDPQAASARLAQRAAGLGVPRRDGRGRQPRHA